MLKQPRPYTILLSLLALAALGLLLIRHGSAPGKSESPRPAVARSASAGLPADGPPPSTDSPATSAHKAKADEPLRLPPPDPALLARFKALHARLLSGLSREATLAGLASLKQAVHDLPPDVAAATLIALLASGDDAPTGLAFIVGDEGVLAETPSYRVGLLDLLGQTDPDATVAYSRIILAETTRPDEYALALRNLAWLNHDNALSAEIGTRFAAMLDRDDWRTDPTAGYLEAFDVAAALGGAGMVGELASVLRLTTPEGRVIESAVNRAAFIALDRIMLREPDTVAGLFQADPAFLDFAPNHRASLLARLDPASPAQQQALRTYLTALDPQGPELAYFVRIFPNANFFESNRLVTSWETASATVPAARVDQTALAFVDTLLPDTTYAALAPSLQKVRDRLQSFANESAPAVAR